jgi:hypothetical protein
MHHHVLLHDLTFQIGRFANSKESDNVLRNVVAGDGQMPWVPGGDALDAMHVPQLAKLRPRESRVEVLAAWVTEAEIGQPTDVRVRKWMEKHAVDDASRCGRQRCPSRSLGGRQDGLTPASHQCWTQQVSDWTDIFTFFLWNFGNPDFQPAVLARSTKAAAYTRPVNARSPRSLGCVAATPRRNQAHFKQALNKRSCLVPEDPSRHMALRRAVKRSQRKPRLFLEQFDSGPPMKIELLRP